MQLLALLGIMLAAVAVIGLAWWIERATRRPGLAYIIVAVLMILGALSGFADGKRLLPILFVVQSIGFFYFGYWRSSQTRSDNFRAPEA